MNCSVPSRRLRYCPKCARAQWESFGTAYWQILPQINGFEICPVHLEPIRETVITHEDIMHRFFPASSILLDQESAFTYEDSSRLHWIDSHWNTFLQMAQDILFVFRFSVSGFLLGEKIRKVLLYDLLPVRSKWEYALLDDPILDLCGDISLIEYLASLYRDHYRLVTQISLAPALFQLRICRLLFGDIKRFVSRRV